MASIISLEVKITFGEKCQKMRVSIFYIYLLHNNKVVIQNSVYRFIWSFYIELVRSAPVSLFLFRRVIEWSLIIFSHYIARTNYFLIIWWWCLLCTRGTLGSHYFQNFTLKSREKEKSSRPVFTMCGEPCKLEGEVTSLSESSQGEVGDNREKWGDFWEKLIAINRNIVSRPLWCYPAQIE